MSEVAVILSVFYTTNSSCHFVSVHAGHKWCGKDEQSEICSGHSMQKSNVQHLNKAKLFFIDVLQHLFVILDAQMLDL